MASTRSRTTPEYKSNRHPFARGIREFLDLCDKHNSPPRTSATASTIFAYIKLGATIGAEGGHARTVCSG